MQYEFQQFITIMELQNMWNRLGYMSTPFGFQKSALKDISIVGSPPKFIFNCELNINLSSRTLHQNKYSV